MDELQSLLGEGDAQRLSRTTMYTVKGKTSFAPPREESTPPVNGEGDLDNADNSEDAAQDEFTAPVERAPLRQPHDITAMVALVVDSAKLDMLGQQAIQPIDLITIEDVFSKEEVAAIEELPMFHSDEYIVPIYEEECGVHTLSDEHARGRSQTAHQGQQRDHSFPRNRDLTGHRGQRRDQSAPPRLRNKALYERTAIPPSKATKDVEVKGLRLFADTILSEKRYNLGMAKTHMLQYGVDTQFNAKHVVREALLFQRQRKVNYLTQNKANVIRDHLRYHNNVIVSKNTVLKILFRGQRVVSAGRLPYTKTDMEDDEVRVEQQDKSIFARKPKEGKEKWLSKEEKKAIREEAILKARKAFKPRTAHSDDAGQEFKQNTDTKVHLVIDPHPHTKTVARLTITANYVDESQPGVQPSHKAQINLTDRNLRPRPLVTVPGLPDDEYEPHHTITDVTHESWSPRLHKLFNVGSNKTYFRDLQKANKAGQRLLLISARHNNMPWCSNLLVNDYPTDTHKSLGTAMEHSPRIYLLVRAQVDTIEDMMTALVQDFAAQVTYDPLTDLYCNPAQQMSVNSTNVKNLADRPKFVTPPEYTFESFQDYKNRAGIGALIEHNWKEKKTTHTAKAVFVPIRETWNKRLELYMTYAATVTLDDDSCTKVALTKGDTVHVTIEPDNPATPAAFWRGKVVPRQNITGMAEVTIIIQRPRNRDGTTDDDRSDFCSLTPREIDETNIAQLKHKVMNSKRVAVQIASPLELKEMKLHMDALNRLTVSTKLLEKDAAKYNALMQHQKFFMCHAPKHLVKKGIYDDIDQAHRQDDHVRNQLLDYQVSWLDKLIDQGMLDATALLGGPSGCGKTRATAEVVMPFLGSIVVPNDDVVRKRNELHAFFNKTSDDTDEGTNENKVDSGAAVQPNSSAPEVDPAWNTDVPTGSWGTDAPTGSWDTDAQAGWGTVNQTGAPEIWTEAVSGDTIVPAEDITSSPSQDIASSSPPDSSAQENDNQSGLSGKTPTFEIGTPCFVLPSKEFDYTLERGRITAVAAQNETVEEFFTTYSSTAKAYCKAVGLPVPLVVRKHARSTELNAVRAMLHFMFKIEVDLPFMINPEITPQPGTHSEGLYNAYLKMYQGSEFRNIRDPRFKHLESSEAHRVLQLSRDDDEQPEDIKACFTEDERATIRQQLRPLRDAEIELLNNEGNFTKEIDDKIRHAAKLGLDWIEQKASIIVTSASQGLEPRFVMIRRPHAIVIEEITRMSDAVLWGYWSKYWDVLARLGSGDWRQLGPQLFGKKIDNPFHFQVKLSLLGRAYATGFPVHQFMVTHRFGNEELLKICQMVNNLPNLAMSDTAERQEKTEKIMKTHLDLYKKSSACMFVDVKDSNPQKDVTGSYYNVQTAVTTLHIINALVGAMQGTCLAVVSPYNAQTNLHQYLCENAIRMAKEQGDQSHAEQLAKITFSTIDSYMGKENEYIVVDTLAHAGHLTEVPRTIVAFTRARLGLTIVGDAAIHSSSTDTWPNTHPLKQLTRSLCQSHRFFEMTTSKQRKLVQYTDALQALGLIAGEKIVDLRSMPIAIPISAIDNVYDSDDESDDDDDAIFLSRFAESKIEPGHVWHEADATESALSDNTIAAVQSEQAQSEADVNATNKVDDFDFDNAYKLRQMSPLISLSDPRYHDDQYHQAAHLLHRAFSKNLGYDESHLVMLSKEQKTSPEMMHLKEIALVNDLNINYLTFLYDTLDRSFKETSIATRILCMQWYAAESHSIPYDILRKFVEETEDFNGIFTKLEEAGWKIEENSHCVKYDESDVSPAIPRDIKEWMEDQPRSKDAVGKSNPDFLDDFANPEAGSEAGSGSGSGSGSDSDDLFECDDGAGGMYD